MPCDKHVGSGPTRSGLFSRYLSFNFSPAVARGFFFVALSGRANHKIALSKPLKENGSAAAPRVRIRPRSFGRSSIMGDVERFKPESGLTLLWLSTVGIAVVALFVCAAALFATIEFVYRRLIAVPIAWLLSRLALGAWRGTSG